MWIKGSFLILSFCKTLTHCKDHFIDYVEVNVLISVFYWIFQPNYNLFI